MGSTSTHGVHIEWLEVGSRVTGFYFVMKDGTTHEITGIFDPNSEHMRSLSKQPGKFEIVCFSNTDNIPDKQVIRWPTNLHEQVVVRRAVDGAGLILQDGTKTKPGPVGYRRIDVGQK